MLLQLWEELLQTPKEVPVLGLLTILTCHGFIQKGSKNEYSTRFTDDSLFGFNAIKSIKMDTS